MKTLRGRLGTGVLAGFGIVAIMLLFFTGCGRHIIVRTPSGEPIEGVKVSVTYASFGGPQVITDRKGSAAIGKDWGFTLYNISFEKDGYGRDEYYAWPAKWPWHVTLYPGDAERTEELRYDLNGVRPLGTTGVDVIVRPPPITDVDER
jgi:hypothetical protein